MLKISTFVLGFGMGAQLLLSPAAFAAGFDDPNSVDWRFRYNRSDNSYANAWKAYKKEGFIPIDIETDKARGIKFAGVWQKNTDGRKWSSNRNMTGEAFGKRWKELKNKGYRPIDIDTEVINGKVRYSLIMVKNKEGLKWASNRNLSSAKFSEIFNARKNNYKPVDIDAVQVGGKMRYSVIWLENKAKKKWVERRDMSPSTYGQRYKEYRDKGYRITDLDCYAKKGKLTYAAIWEKNQAGRGWAAYREMSAQGFRNKWKELSDKGMRIIDIEVCPAKSGGGVQYAAVWRENNSRHDWAGRKDAQKLLADFVDDNSAPGVSAAVISKGKVVFRSGSGFADRGKNKKAHGGTIYRTASLAKSITGVLAFDMQDADMINLSERTDLTLSKLESQHRHTVLQLLQNNSCVGNYSDVPGDENSDQTQYASAQITLTDKQGGVLQSNDAIYSPCTPGSNNKYSTHGYTIAAAALEKKSGKNFKTLLRERVSDELGLSSLRAETRTTGASSGDLAKLYAKGGSLGFTAVTDANFQNDSWKWGGGGMQASALDMARLGNALLDNKLFPESVRDDMWKGTSASSGYGAGWNTDSTTEPKLISKRGRQQAALAHIRIDVDDDIVVVAMTNGSYTSSEGVIITNLTTALMNLAKTNP